MNDGFSYEIDPRTRHFTAITGDQYDEDVRSACDSLNRRRTRGLLEASSYTPPGEQVAVDVWATTFGEQAREWEVPLVDLGKLGLQVDEDGFVQSSDLTVLPAGAEAQPYADFDARVVYKLFDLKSNGSIGKKLAFRSRSEGFEIGITDATWLDTIWKITILNRAGGLPTELVGLAESGDFLIAKQPLAGAIEEFYADREIAEAHLRGVVPVGVGLRQRVIVTMSDPDEFWLVGDLHERNIMRDAMNQPVIIDALLGRVTPSAMQELDWLRKACEDARTFRETGQTPVHPFEDVDEDEL